MFRRTGRDERGVISILGALLLVAVIGFSALAVEYGHGLLQKVENQRIADLAAYGAALVYNTTGSTDSASSAAGNIVTLNGLPNSSASTALVTSPANSANQAMQVTVTTSLPLLLARVATNNTSLPVSATAYAELRASAPGCIIALNPSGTGIAVNGGATLSAPACAIASNSVVTAHACSNTITTKTISYNASTAPTPTCAFINPSGGTSKITKAATSDPLAGNSEVDRRHQSDRHRGEHDLAERPFRNCRHGVDIGVEQDHGVTARGMQHDLEQISLGDHMYRRRAIQFRQFDAGWRVDRHLHQYLLRRDLQFQRADRQRLRRTA